jgi:hypothetical protein
MGAVIFQVKMSILKLTSSTTRFNRQTHSIPNKESGYFPGFLSSGKHLIGVMKWQYNIHFRCNR